MRWRVASVLSSLLAITVAPAVVSAHEKWFVDKINVAAKPMLFSSWNTMNASLLLAAFFACAAALLFHLSLRTSPSITRTAAFWGRFSAWSPALLRSLTGLLLFTATFQGFLFAPDLQAIDLPAGIERSVLTLQLVVGMALVVGVAPRFISIMGASLYILALFVFPPLSVLSYLHLAGVFIYLMIVGDPTLPKEVNSDGFLIRSLLDDLSRAKEYALPILRIFTGLSFMILGFYYKIYQPAYALEFLNTHPVNFIQALGFSTFSNELFVLSAGLVEILLGIVIACGILPRLTAGVLFALLLLTLSVFGIYELLGHLPIFAIAYTLLTSGSGKRWSV